MDNSRIAAFLAQGLRAAQVASIVGCTPGYISQLTKEEGFKSLLQEKLDEEANKPADNEDLRLTNKYLALEHRLLDSMDAALATAELPAITRALEVVATRQEKRALRLLPKVAGEGSNVQILNLVMPAHAIPEYTLNAQSEVVSINGKNMAPMSSSGVRNLFKQVLEAQPQKQAEELGFSASPQLIVVEKEVA